MSLVLTRRFGYGFHGGVPIVLSCSLSCVYVNCLYFNGVVSTCCSHVVLICKPNFPTPNANRRISPPHTRQENNRHLNSSTKSQDAKLVVALSSSGLSISQICSKRTHPNLASQSLAPNETTTSSPACARPKTICTDSHRSSAVESLAVSVALSVLPASWPTLACRQNSAEAPSIL